MAEFIKLNSADNSIIKDEGHLEELLSKDPSMIEEDLKLVGRQYTVPAGTIDLLFADSNRSLVITEVKAIQTDEILLQALRYYTCIDRSRPRLGEIENVMVDYEKPIRIMLVAPSFSESLKEIVGYLQQIFKIDLVIYKCLQIGRENQYGILYEKLEVPLPWHTPPVPTVPKHLERIRGSEEVKELCKEAVAWFEEKGLTVNPVQSYIGFKEGGFLKGMISTAWDYFNASYLVNETWRKVSNIKSREDWEKAKEELEGESLEREQ